MKFKNKISYLNRNFEDYKQSIVDITRQYYPDVFAKLFKMACVLFEFENNPITTAKNTVDGLDMQPHKAPVINEIITDRILIVPI